MTPARHDAQRVELYFVERCREGKVIARISSLGLVKATIANEMVAVQATRVDAKMSGDWSKTKSGRYRCIRLASA
jgi:hypothetical protein